MSSRPGQPSVDDGGSDLDHASAKWPLAGSGVAALFMAFAFGYFLSALLRAIVATLAPVLAAELALSASSLGLLAGAYFLGFALMQLPLGSALDRYGPRRVLLTLMTLAVIGCVAFSLARSLGQLVLARLLIGIGVAASLMAPLTAFVRLVEPSVQLRLNAWMLMTGSLGMVASTVPVQLLLPLTGWRGLFAAVGALLLLAMAAIAWVAPRAAPRHAEEAAGHYREIVRHPAFVQAWPLGFFAYAGLIAMQSLWAGPWMTQVGGATPDEAARGLFFINLSMLVSFFAWGVAMPRLVRRGITADRLIGALWVVGPLVLALVIALGPLAGAPAWALWCVSTSVVTLIQPAVAQKFPSHRAGRALSAFNLVIFLGVFVNQWAIGLAIDVLAAFGLDTVTRFRVAFGLLLLATLWAGIWYRRHGGGRPASAQPGGR